VLDSFGTAMGRLVDAYDGARATAGAVTSALAADSLEPTLAALCARGREAHPDLALDDETFVAHLARCGAEVGSADARDDLHVGDVYLASACLRGDVVAIERLRTAHRPALGVALRHVDASRTTADEVEQQMWEAVLVGTAASPPKLLSYSGQGPLAGWLAIVAQRLAITLHRKRAALERAHEAVRDEPEREPQDPELALLKERYREHFQAAMREALSELDDRARVVFRLHLIDGLTVERIAKSYGVSQSTVSRWMDGARQQVMATARDLLCARANVAPGEVDSIARLVASQLELSLSQVLGRARSSSG
jgi:RNA polymerase sigma-70 factor (ECF subfamily)